MNTNPTMKTIALKISSVLLLLLFVNVASAQNFIYVKNKTNARTNKIYLNQTIGVKTEKMEEFNQGAVSQIGEDFIVVNDSVYMLEKITDLRIYRSGLRTASGVLMVGTGVFAGIFLVNNLIEGDLNYLQNQLVWIGAIAVLAGVTYAFSRKTYKTKKGWNFENYNIPLE